MVSPMTGATSTVDGASGLVPVPLAGDQNKYLRGDGTWANPTETVQTTLNNLIGTDTGKTIRQIAISEISNLVNGAPEAFDTLGEIYDWINTHDTIIDVEDATERLEAVETAVFGNGSNVNGLQNDVAAINTNIRTINTNISNIEDSLRWKDLVEE